MSSRRVIVTGGAGLIGSALTAKLIEQGNQVIVIDNFSSGRREFVHPAAIIIHHDLSFDFPPVATPWDVEAIYHCAAKATNVAEMISQPIVFTINAVIDHHVFHAAARWNIPLLYCSSSCVYPVTAHNPLQEDDVKHGFHRDSLYGWLKLLGEQALLSCMPGTCKIVRLFNIYGPHEVPSAAARVVPMLVWKAIKSGNPLKVWGSGEQFRSFLFVDDAVDAIIAVMERGTPGQPYNVGAPEPVAISEIATAVADGIGLDVCDIV